ncbi:MAG: hypothetical protein KBD17_02275 [Candidatus Pacebacteria bacterium]|nr:hypothetical protein [Candidatus Paceibacterota bacterium]
MSTRELFDSLIFSADGKQIKTSPNQPFQNIGADFFATFGRDKSYNLMKKYNVANVSDLVRVFDAMKKKSQNIGEEVRKKQETIAFRTEQATGFSHTEADELLLNIGENVVVCDITKPEDKCYILVDFEKKRILEEDFNGSLRAIARKQGKQRSEEIKKTAIAVEFIFNPNLPFGLIKQDSSRVLKLNTFSEVRWEEYDKTFPGMDCFVELMKFLIPDEYQRSIVASWMLFAQKDRNEFVLVFSGEKGVGKSFLTEAFRRLVGYHQTMTGKRDLLSNRFNNWAGAIIGLVIEEAEVNTLSSKNALKAMLNPNISVEAKGIDIQRNVNNFVNVIMTTNEERDIYVEYDDRRYQCIDTNDEKPPEHITAMCDTVTKELRAEIDVVKNMSAIRAFKTYLESIQLKDYKHYKPDTNIKTFWHLVDANLGLGTRFLLVKAKEENGEWVSIDKLRTKFEKQGSRNRFPSDSKVKKIAKYYTPMGEKVLEVKDNEVRWAGKKKEPLFPEE